MYKWAIQKTRVAKELEGAQDCERTSASALSKKTNKRASERASRKDNMDEIDKYRIKMNKKHYPIYWKIKDNEIEITDINNKKLPKHHEVYQAELSFIQDRISEMEFSGEIVMM